jgi:hypothetical protein
MKETQKKRKMVTSSSNNINESVGKLGEARGVTLPAPSFFYKLLDRYLKTTCTVFAPHGWRANYGIWKTIYRNQISR